MRHYTLLPLLSVLFLSTPSAQAQAQMVTISPEQIGQIFCIGSLGNDMSPVQGILSEDLTSLIDLAWERNTAFELANPGDKPPLGDGLPWRTYPDYADGCVVDGVSVENLVATVTVTYSFSDYPEGTYSNALTLLPAYYTDGDPLVWRIDDIDLGNGETLRQALYAAINADA